MFYKNLFSPKGGDIEKEQESDVKQGKKVGLHDSEVIRLGCVVIHQDGQLLPLMPFTSSMRALNTLNHISFPN
jgi:hypothetical protein